MRFVGAIIIASLFLLSGTAGAEEKVIVPVKTVVRDDPKEDPPKQDSVDKRFSEVRKGFERRRKYLNLKDPD